MRAADAPGPRLAIAPDPEPRPHPAKAEAERAWTAFGDAVGALLHADAAIDDLAAEAVALTAALADRDATIAALAARVGALVDICWGLGVALLCIFVLLLFAWRF